MTLIEALNKPETRSIIEQIEEIENKGTIDQVLGEIRENLINELREYGYEWR